ncbi:hypothetical protein LXA43DRAFT_1133881 [Ganoderma leucocontextum]|nr:hypothetical protein LXA43DRAFT_1133881 [Ganoderma leucocontextum]
MQAGLGDLLHFGDLAFPEDTSTEHLDLDVTAQCLLAEEDRVILKQLAPIEVQEWCLSRIAEHRNHNRVLRELYGSAARDAISKTKSHVRALRSAYNDAAPINRCLPPEVLMEVFSNVHPAVNPRRIVPVLRVCSYWRRLLFRTPQFWANLLSLPTWMSWEPRCRMGRFSAALARSVPRSVAVSVPYCDGAIVDILTPHASRLSSLKVGPTEYTVEYVARLLEQHIPRLTHLAILHSSWCYTSTLTLSFPLYPNIQALELQRTGLYTPVVPSISLCHLKLAQCAIRPYPSPDGRRVSALCAVHDALELFPNLETLAMTCSLSDDDRNGLIHPVPVLKKTVHLPRLRRLEIKDIPAYIPCFLSHLVFPSTTALVLEPAYNLDLSQGPTAVPLFPGIVPLPAPHAELGLHLDFRGAPNEVLARWETRGDGVRPVRITLLGAAHNVTVVARFTRELVDALAPAPGAPPARGQGLTSLTAEGACGSWNYWDVLLPAVPGLRRLTYDTWWTEMQELVGVLGKRMASDGDGFVCAGLEHLGLVWHMPPGVDVGSEEEWEPLRQHRDDDGRDESELAASLRAFCDTLGACLVERAERCGRLQKLSVALHQWQLNGEGIVLQGWQMALAEQRLRDRLGDLVGAIAVVDEIG